MITSSDTRGQTNVNINNIKIANQIFAEHKFQKQEIANLKNIVITLEKKDSIQISKLTVYKSSLASIKHLLDNSNNKCELEKEKLNKIIAIRDEEVKIQKSKTIKTKIVSGAIFLLGTILVIGIN